MASEKGQDFERVESRFLSLWWTKNERDDIFWRNRVKVTSKTPNAERQLGDVTAFHTIGLPFVEMFNVELKAGYSKMKTKQAKKDNDKRNEKRIQAGKEPIPLNVRNTPWDLLDIIDGKGIDDNLEILNFWKQCLSDAQLSGRIPLLIFKRDFHLPVVCIDTSYFSEIIECQGNLLSRRIIMADENNRNILAFYRHSDFFQWLNPNTIKLIHQNHMNNPPPHTTVDILVERKTCIYKKRI